MYTHTHTHAETDTHTETETPTYPPTHTHTQRYTHTHTHTRARAHTRIHTHTHTERERERESDTQRHIQMAYTFEDVVRTNEAMGTIGEQVVFAEGCGSKRPTFLRNTKGRMIVTIIGMVGVIAINLAFDNLVTLFGFCGTSYRPQFLSCAILWTG